MSLVRKDDKGIFIVTDGTRFRPGSITGYAHAYDMSDGGLVAGNHVRARHMNQTSMARLTLSDGRKLVWASDWDHEQEARWRPGKGKGQ